MRLYWVDWVEVRYRPIRMKTQNLYYDSQNQQHVNWEIRFLIFYWPTQEWQGLCSLWLLPNSKIVSFERFTHLSKKKSRFLSVAWLLLKRLSKLLITVVVVLSKPAKKKRRKEKLRMISKKKLLLEISLLYQLWENWITLQNQWNFTADYHD